jgi:hypothetical protein
MEIQDMYDLRRMLNHGLFLVFFMILIVTSCTTLPEQPAAEIKYPTPTTGVNLGVDQNQILIQPPPEIEQSAVPTVSGIFSSSNDQSNHTTTNEPQQTPEAVSPPRREIATEIITQIYDEELNPNWMIVNQSGMEIDLDSSDVAMSGEVSFRFAPNKIYDTLLFALKESATDEYERGEVLGLTFWINSGDLTLSNDSLSVTVIGSNDFPYWVEDDNSVTNSYDPVFSETRLNFLGVDRDIPPNSWVQVELWLNDRVYDPDYKYVTGFYIKNDDMVLRSVYLDDIQLILLGTSGETSSETRGLTSPTAADTTSNENNNSLPSVTTVFVDAGQLTHPISPMVYGISVAPVEVVASLQAGINSWGGNPNTRYNWEIGNAWNAGRDYYYRNGNYNIPSGNVADGFIEGTLDAGAEVRLSVPTLGWVAKNDDLDTCSFPLPDGSCGDAAGASCLNPGEIADPTFANVSTDTNFVLGWLRHIYDTMGFDVRIIAMDNEPELWGITHYDVHPECTTYQEILDKYLEYASVIRQEFPEVELAGPVTCCWYYYWNSAGGFTDKLLNGNQDFLPWFLDQVWAYDTENNIQTINVLDIHYYPDGLFNEDVDQDTSAHRMRATRSLWDSAYVDESWINEPIYLIPRMQNLIAEHYPELKLGISEWNFGGWGHMNGALAVADVLGILGREDVYYANYYGYPEIGTPEFFSFKIYTNYDDRGGKFGDTSVQTEVENPDQVAAFAAIDSETSNLHLMLINKNPTETLEVQLDLSGYSTPSNTTLYRYSEEEMDEIVSAEVEWPAFDGVIELPPYSISHYVIEAASNDDYMLPNFSKADIQIFGNDSAKTWSQNPNDR